MIKIFNELKEITYISYEKYKNLDDTITSIKLSADKWSLKEIIGHLIDSAANNHQRFIRLQICSKLIFPDYQEDNNKWITLSQYNKMIYKNILLLWKHYNILLMNIIKNVGKKALSNYWIMDNKKFTLKELIIDYIRHIKEHLEQFEKRWEEIIKQNIDSDKKWKRKSLL